MLSEVKQRYKSVLGKVWGGAAEAPAESPAAEGVKEEKEAEALKDGSLEESQAICAGPDA